MTITSGTGTCTITASKAADTNYLVANSAGVSITIGKASQATLTVTGLPGSAVYGQAGITAGTSGGNGSGAVNIRCWQLHRLQCGQQFRRRDHYERHWHAHDHREQGRRHQLSCRQQCRRVDHHRQGFPGDAYGGPGLPGSAVYGQAGITAGTSGGNGSGAVTYDAGSSIACSVGSSSGAVTITSGTGTCTITASKAADTNYLVANSAGVSITIGKASQATLTVTGLPGSAVYGQAGITAGTSGGNGSGAVTYDAGSSIACSVGSSSGAVTITSGTGTCTITVSKAADTDYLVANSAGVSITISKATQAALSVTGPTTATYGDADATITTSGGSGTGAVTFDAGTSTACSIVSGKLHVISGSGTCDITATKAADSDYNLATSASFAVTLNKATQAALSVTGPTTATYGDADATITTSGGSGTGAVTFDAGTSTACSIVSGKLHVISGSGTCDITATKAADSDYNLATSASFAVTLNKATPTATLAVTNSPVVYDGLPHAATVGITASSVPGSVSNILTGGVATQTNVGTYAVTADFVPTDATNYNTVTGLSVGDFVIRPDAPVVAGTSPLSWPSVPGATGYQVYESTEPYFTPSPPPVQEESSLTYTFPLNTTNYYYIVRAFNGPTQSDNSNRVGRFTFTLVPGQ